MNYAPPSANLEPAKIPRGPARVGIWDNGNIEVCWAHYENCITFSHVNARGTAAECGPNSPSGLRELVANVRANEGEHQGNIQAWFNDCKRGIGHWLGRLYLVTTLPVDAGDQDVRGYVVEVSSRPNPNYRR